MSQHVEEKSLHCAVTQDHTHTLTHLYDGIYRTRLLTEAAVDAFGHVDVVAGRPPAAVSASLCFDGDGLYTHVVRGGDTH